MLSLSLRFRVENRIHYFLSLRDFHPLPTSPSLTQHRGLTQSSHDSRPGRSVPFLRPHPFLVVSCPFLRFQMLSNTECSHGCITYPDISPKF